MVLRNSQSSGSTQAQGGNKWSKKRRTASRPGLQKIWVIAHSPMHSHAKTRQTQLRLWALKNTSTLERKVTEGEGYLFQRGCNLKWQTTPLVHSASHIFISTSHINKQIFSSFHFKSGQLQKILPSVLRVTFGAASIYQRIFSTLNNSVTIFTWMQQHLLGTYIYVLWFNNTFPLISNCSNLVWKAKTKHLTVLCSKW